jgi:hypothetical protein
MTEQAQTKPIWQSGGIVTAFIALIFGVLQYFGIAVDPYLQEIIMSDETHEKIVETEKARGLLTIAISIAFGYFRIRATRAIEGGFNAPINWIRGLFKKK